MPSGTLPFACSIIACSAASSSATALFLEQSALLGAHRLRFRAELPGLVSRQLEREFHELRVLQTDGLRLALDVLIALREVEMVLTDALQHLLCQRSDGLGRETLKVIVLEVTHVLHVGIM